MLPFLHRYPIGLEYETLIYGKEKIIGYLSPYSYYGSVCYIVWDYGFDRIMKQSEWWIDKYATFVT